VLDRRFNQAGGDEIGTEHVDLGDRHAHGSGCLFRGGDRVLVEPLEELHVTFRQRWSRHPARIAWSWTVGNDDHAKATAFALPAADEAATWGAYSFWETVVRG